MLRRAGRTAKRLCQLGLSGAGCAVGAGYWDSAGGSDVVPIQDNDAAG